jgi:DNA segregation ATPase FtsK/SpoIIIE, S-DNA-T family
VTRRRIKKGKQQVGVWQRLRQWRPRWRIELGPVQREAIGLGLLILVALSLLGLLRISTAPALAWWAKALRQSFGWSAYLVVLGVGLGGVGLLWRKLHDRVKMGPGEWIGLELLLLVIAGFCHLPLVSSLGGDGAFHAAQQGRGGGYVGWVLALPLVDGLGVLVGSFVLLVVLGLSLYLLMPIFAQDLWSWSRHRYRLLLAAISRRWIARQGSVVLPQPAEVPWWEREPEAPDAKEPRRAANPRKKVSTTKRTAKRQREEGQLPPFDLLDPASPRSYADTDVRRKTQVIEETLASFGVPAQVVEVQHGPTVTQFGLEPGYIERRTADGKVQQQRVRVNRIVSLEKDLSLALAASPVRMEAPVPGRSVIGLEVPNEVISLVSLRNVIESPEFQSMNSPLSIALGENVAGSPVAVNLALMPHLLIAGATGSGKSVCVNAVVCCLLCHNRPEDLRLLMVDRKMVELTSYNGIPHLIAPVVIDLEQVVGALAWVTREMDDRYKLFHKVGVRNRDEYNRRVSRRRDEETLPALVLFVDELADLMMVAPDEVERHICRIAQMGRATGIHLVIATQRPSVDVVTGLIKANFPARISFAVTSQVDSRVILDQGGAENLLGRGDMLFMSPQQPAPVRVQGCFVSDKEIERLVAFWRDQPHRKEQAPLFPPWLGLEVEEEDDLLEQAIRLAAGRQTISTSFIQRRLSIGFPRAARLVDQLEERGIVGPDEGGGRGRKVLSSQQGHLEEE